MKFLFVAPRFHTNQVEIVRGLKNKGHEVRFYTALIGPIEDHHLLEPEVLPESRLSRIIRNIFGDGGVNKKRYFPDPIYCWRSIKKYSPDVVIIRIHGRVFSYMVAIFARLLRKKVVFYQQLETAKLKKYYSFESVKSSVRNALFYGRLFFFRAAWITPLLSSSEDMYSLPNRCHYVPFAVPIYPGKKSIAGNIRFLMVGKYEERKRHKLLLKAAAALRKEFNFTVTFVGEASSESQKKLKDSVFLEAEKLDLDDSLYFSEDVSHADMVKTYQNHDVFILPSTKEPASISVLEAMGCALPAVCSDTCGTKTYIEDQVNGFVFKDGDLQSLLETMKFFLRYHDECLRMSLNASEYAKANFSFDVYYHYLAFAMKKEFGIQLDR